MAKLSNERYRMVTPGCDFRKIRGALAERMLPQTALAEATGYGHEYIRRMLSGAEVVSVPAQRRIRAGLRVLRIDPDEVLGLDPTEAVRAGE